MELRGLARRAGNSRQQLESAWGWAQNSELQVSAPCSFAHVQSGCNVKFRCLQSGKVQDATVTIGHPIPKTV